MFGHTDIVRFLIAAGAGVIVRSLIAAGAGVNFADARGRTPLDVAIRNSHESIISALIEAGATKGPEADSWGR